MRLVGAGRDGRDGAVDVAQKRRRGRSSGGGAQERVQRLVPTDDRRPCFHGSPVSLADSVPAAVRSEAHRGPVPSSSLARCRYLARRDERSARHHQPLPARRKASRRARGSLPEVDAARAHRGQLPAHGHVHPVRRRGAAGHRLRGHRAGGVHRGVPQGVSLHRPGGRGRRRPHQDHPQGRRDHRGHDPRRGRDHGAGRPGRRLQSRRARQAGRRPRDVQQGDEVGREHALPDGRRPVDGRPARDAGRVRGHARAGRRRRRSHRLRARQDRHHPAQRAPVPDAAAARRRCAAGRRRGADPASPRPRTAPDAPPGGVGAGLSAIP